MSGSCRSQAGRRAPATWGCPLYAGLGRPGPDATSACRAERGEFLVLELGDTHLRVLLVELSGDTRQTVTVKDRRFPVSDAIAQGPGEKVRGQGPLAPPGHGVTHLASGGAGGGTAAGSMPARSPGPPQRVRQEWGAWGWWELGAEPGAGRGAGLATGAGRPLPC